MNIEDRIARVAGHVKDIGLAKELHAINMRLEKLKRNFDVLGSEKAAEALSAHLQTFQDLRAWDNPRNHGQALRLINTFESLAEIISGRPLVEAEPNPPVETP